MTVAGDRHPGAAGPKTLRTTLSVLDVRLHRRLRAIGLTALRLSLGLVFLGFGVLKFIPGMSPAPDLAVVTTRILTSDLVSAPAARLLVASLECATGSCLLVGGPLLRSARATGSPGRSSRAGAPRCSRPSPR